MTWTPISDKNRHIHLEVVPTDVSEQQHRSTRLCEPSNAALLWFTEDGWDHNTYSIQRTTQRYLLGLFYIELSGLYWTRYNGWMTNTDVCNWFGMECSQANFSTSIDLKYNNLSGLIPINIGYLSLLSEIDFAGNRLHGSIPSQVGSLENLGMLTVAANQVVGAVPSSLANLTLLESLDLSMNQLTGTIPLAMCSDLLSLRHLIVDCDGRYSIMENCTCCM